MNLGEHSEQVGFDNIRVGLGMSLFAGEWVRGLMNPLSDSWSISCCDIHAPS